MSQRMTSMGEATWELTMLVALKAPVVPDIQAAPTIGMKEPAESAVEESADQSEEMEVNQEKMSKASSAVNPRYVAVSDFNVNQTSSEVYLSNPNIDLKVFGQNTEG